MENGYLTWVQLLDTIEGDVDFLLLVRGVGNLYDVALLVVLSKQAVA